MTRTRRSLVFCSVVAFAAPAGAQVIEDKRDPRFLGHASPRHPCEWRPLHGNCHIDAVEWQDREHNAVRIFVSGYKADSCRRLAYRLEFPDGTTGEHTAHVYGHDRWVMESYLSGFAPKGQPKVVPLSCEVGYPGRPTGGYAELGPDGKPVAGPPPVVHPNPPVDLVLNPANAFPVSYARAETEENVASSSAPRVPEATAPKPEAPRSPPQAAEKKDDKPSGFSSFMSRWGTTIVGVAAGVLASGRAGGDPRPAQQILETLRQQQSGGAGGDVVASSGEPLSSNCEEAEKQAMDRIGPFTRSQPTSAGDATIMCRNYRAHTSFYESMASSLENSCGADHRSVQGARRQADSYRTQASRTCR
jgi:hypothetical protein